MHLLHRHPKNKHLKELTETQRKDPPIPGFLRQYPQLRDQLIESIEHWEESNSRRCGRPAEPWGDGPGPPYMGPNDSHGAVGHLFSEDNS